MFFASTIQAQISVNVNIGTLPPWGPQVETYTRYYYLPDIQAYYDINRSVFVYFYNGNWVRKRHLPERFHHYDLYRGRKVVVHDYYGDYPYSHCNYHKIRNNRSYSYDQPAENFRKAYYKKQQNEGRERFAHGKGNGHRKQKDWED